MSTSRGQLGKGLNLPEHTPASQMGEGRDVFWTRVWGRGQGLFSTGEKAGYPVDFSVIFPVPLIPSFLFWIEFELD